jgi:hypothetical protein
MTTQIANRPATDDTPVSSSLVGKSSGLAAATVKCGGFYRPSNPAPVRRMLFADATAGGGAATSAAMREWLLAAERAQVCGWLCVGLGCV